jgi:hypothetical protein
MPSPLNAHLSVIAEHVDRYGSELADLAVDQRPADEDVAAALYEAERALRSASRSLRRAIKLGR